MSMGIREKAIRNVVSGALGSANVVGSCKERLRSMRSFRREAIVALLCPSALDIGKK